MTSGNPINMEVDMILSEIKRYTLNVRVYKDEIEKGLKQIDSDFNKVYPVIYARMEKHKSKQIPEPPLPTPLHGSGGEAPHQPSKLLKKLYHDILLSIHPDKNGNEQHKDHDDICKAYENSNISLLLHYVTKLNIMLPTLDQYIDELYSLYSDLLKQVSILQDSISWKYICGDKEGKDIILDTMKSSFNFKYPPPELEVVQDRIMIFEREITRHPEGTSEYIHNTEMITYLREKEGTLKLKLKLKLKLLDA